MTIARWNPPVSVSADEEMVLKRLGRVRKLFGFLRKHRHEVIDEVFQDELESMYRQTGAGKDPVAPGLMAMAVLVQGYMGVSDAEAVEMTVVDRRWQLVLDCLDSREPAFSQGALQGFRERMIAHDMDLRLLERTVEVARSSGEFDWKKLPKTLRVAADSSPFEGAGRVEDAFNLLGRAARNLIDIAGQILGSSRDQVASEASIPLVLESSIKKGLDVDWTDDEAVSTALNRLVTEVASLETWLAAQDLSAGSERDRASLGRAAELVELVRHQNLEETDAGVVSIAQGVAPDRRISVEDAEMRHGRKSAS